MDVAAEKNALTRSTHPAWHAGNSSARMHYHVARSYEEALCPHTTCTSKNLHASHITTSFTDKLGRML